VESAPAATAEPEPFGVAPEAVCLPFLARAGDTFSDTAMSLDFVANSRKQAAKNFGAAAMLEG